MNRSTLLPCDTWADLLTVPAEALSADEQSRLEAHLTVCAACANIRAEYLALSAELRTLPLPGLPTGLPARVLACWQEETSSEREAWIAQLLAAQVQTYPWPEQDDRSIITELLRDDSSPYWHAVCTVILHWLAKITYPAEMRDFFVGQVLITLRENLADFSYDRPLSLYIYTIIIPIVKGHI